MPCATTRRRDFHADADGGWYGGRVPRPRAQARAATNSPSGARFLTRSGNPTQRLALQSERRRRAHLPVEPAGSRRVGHRAAHRGQAARRVECIRTNGASLAGTAWEGSTDCNAAFPVNQEDEAESQAFARSTLAGEQNGRRPADCLANVDAHAVAAMPAMIALCHSPVQRRRRSDVRARGPRHAAGRSPVPPGQCRGGSRSRHRPGDTGRAMPTR